MAYLQIDLQSGYLHDRVVVRINKKVFRLEDVTTKVHGLATSIKTKVRKRSVKVDVNIEGKGISRSEKIELKPHLYLGINIENKELEKFKQRETPFPYI